VQVQGLAQNFVVGRRGEVYVEFPAAGNFHLTAAPPGRNACSFELQAQFDALPFAVAQCQ
jgi:hypothetical protein